MSKLSHTAAVCVAGFFIDPNPNRFVGPKFLHCMLPSPLCGIFIDKIKNIEKKKGNVNVNTQTKIGVGVD